MCSSVLFVVCVSVLFGTSLSCLECVLEPNDWIKPCRDFTYGPTMHQCVTKWTKEFYDWRVIEAGKVGEGYHKNLSEILMAEIKAMVDDFAISHPPLTLRVKRFDNAAHNFITKARMLPRVYGCIPPCGEQKKEAEYNCYYCRYDNCGFPLDCPITEIVVEEKSTIQMWCQVPFTLPSDVKVIWKFADQVKTQHVEEFDEVTVGNDTLYNIPTARSHHEGTYQCEIVSGDTSIVRLYFYLIVNAHVVEGHTELQDIFDLSLLAGGRSLLEPDEPDLPPLLLASLLSALLLLLVLSLGAVLVIKTRVSMDEEDEDEDPPRLLDSSTPRLLDAPL